MYTPTACVWSVLLQFRLWLISEITKNSSSFCYFLLASVHSWIANIKRWDTVGVNVCLKLKYWCVFASICAAQSKFGSTHVFALTLYVILDAMKRIWEMQKNLELIQRVTVCHILESFIIQNWLVMHDLGTSSCTVCDSILSVGSAAYSTYDSWGRQTAFKCDYIQWRASWWLCGLKHMHMTVSRRISIYHSPPFHVSCDFFRSQCSQLLLELRQSFHLHRWLSRGNALNFRAVKCKCWMGFVLGVKRGKTKDRRQDYSWTDGGNGVGDVILQRCTDVRHSSRFSKEKEGFEWKLTLNDGFQCEL